MPTSGIYASGLGRFVTADPYVASGGVGDPGSWNRYAYVGGDPVGRYDPLGLEDCVPSPDADFCVQRTEKLPKTPPAMPPLSIADQAWLYGMFGASPPRPRPNSEARFDSPRGRAAAVQHNVWICGDFYCDSGGHHIAPLPASVMNASDPGADVSWG